MLALSVLHHLIEHLICRDMSEYIGEKGLLLAASVLSVLQESLGLRVTRRSTRRSPQLKTSPYILSTFYKKLIYPNAKRALGGGR